MHPSLRRLTGCSSLALVSLLGCHHGGARASAAAPGPREPRMSDGNVVAIILAANNTDLSYARLVPARSTNPRVRAFGELMVTDHTILNARANEIANRQHILAEDDDTSLGFRDQSADRRDTLRDLQGARFDSTFIANEIQYHQALLASLDALLSPHTRNPELHEFVTNLKPAVSAHLAHAERVRAELAAHR